MSIKYQRRVDFCSKWRRMHQVGILYLYRQSGRDRITSIESLGTTNPNDTLTKISFLFRYTICYKGTGYIQQCSSGLVFSPTQNACVLASSYTCPVSSRSSHLKRHANHPKGRSLKKPHPRCPFYEYFYEYHYDWDYFQPW